MLTCLSGSANCAARICRRPKSPEKAAAEFGMALKNAFDKLTESMKSGGHRPAPWPIAALLSAILAAAVMIAIWHRPPDPFYKGKRLSAHLYVRAGTFGKLPPSAKDERLHRNLIESQSALHALGTNALPLLSSWLLSNESALERKLADFLRKKKIDFPALTAPKQVIALQVLQENPALAAHLVPVILQIIEAGLPQTRIRAAGLLAQVTIAASETERARILDLARPSAESIIQWGPNGTLDRYLDPEGIIGNLVNLQRDGDGAKIGAALFFRDRPILPERVVPLLTRTVISADRTLVNFSAQALGAYGTNAAAALSVLETLARHPNTAISNSAAAAVLQVKGSHSVVASHRP